MAVESDVDKLFDGLGNPSPSPIDSGRFAMTCSPHRADTVLLCGSPNKMVELA